MAFIKNLIANKNYKVEIGKYYISFRRFNDEDFINIKINEEGAYRLITLVNGKAYLFFLCLIIKQKKFLFN